MAVFSVGVLLGMGLEPGTIGQQTSALTVRSELSESESMVKRYVSLSDGCARDFYKIFKIFFLQKNVQKSLFFFTSQHFSIRTSAVPFRNLSTFSMRASASNFRNFSTFFQNAFSQILNKYLERKHLDDYFYIPREK